MFKFSLSAIVNDQTGMLASYDMISHRTMMFVEQNSGLNEDEGHGTPQAVNVDLWTICTKLDTSGYGSVVNRENRFL
jgi:hypothetical protein